MNDIKLKFLFQFFALVLVQVLIFDHVYFLGYINPYIYIAFIIALPLKLNRNYLIFLGFLIGLCVDLFNDTGGIHAGSSVLIAYLRSIIVRLSFGYNYDLDTLKLRNVKLKAQLTFITIMVFAHHLIMFSLAYFSLNYTVEILKNTLYSGIFSSILIFMTKSLLKKQ